MCVWVELAENALSLLRSPARALALPLPLFNDSLFVFNRIMS